MRRPLVALCVLCGVGSVLAGQSQQQTPPVFRGGVALVTVDVTVLDKDGKPVTGLTADDFAVKLDGQVRPVRALDYLHVGGTSDAPVQATQTAAARQTVTNAPPTSESRVFVVLVDDLSFSPDRGKRMFTAAERFVGRLPASDVVGFTTSSGVSVVNPTRDREKVRTGLRSAVGEFFDPRTSTALTADTMGGKGGVLEQRSIGISEALEIDAGSDARLKDVIIRECFGGDPSAAASLGGPQLIASDRCASFMWSLARRTAGLTKHNTARQVQSYLSTINAMRAAPGIKHLVLLSDGLGLGQDFTPLEPVARAAAEAGVQVSVLLEEPDISLATGGLSTSSQQTATNSNPAARWREDTQMFIAGAQTISDMTGGSFHRVIGAPDPFFERVETAASGVYRLGVEIPPAAAAGRDLAVVVTLRKPGMTVHANRHAVVPGPPPVVPIDEQLRSAVASGRGLYTVPISMATALRRSAGAATLELGVNVLVPSSVKGPLTTMFGVVDEATSLRTGRRTVEAPADGGDFRVSFAVPVAPGRYRLRFAVADAEGHVGSIESTVSAQLTKVGPFLASDLFTLWLDRTGRAQFLALEEVPAAAVMLNGSLELYSATAAALPSDLRVRMGLVASGQTTPAIEREIVPDSMGRAAAEFPLTSLPAGVYTLRAVVSAGGVEVGTVATSIRKK